LILATIQKSVSLGRFKVFLKKRLEVTV